jgi:hypothetical protein
MAEADHRAGLSASPGKRLILANKLETLIILVSVSTLAYFTVIFHSFNFAVPISFLAQFIVIFAAFTILLDYIDPPSSFVRAAAGTFR